MYIVIWEYQVRPERQAEFEEVYAPDGAWAELFKKGTGYLGTELLQDENQPLRYLTIDRWISKAEHEAFLSRWEAEYTALDAKCEGLTEREVRLGGWHPGSQG